MKQPTSTPPPATCTGNCKLEGFIVEYCTVCGWTDGFTATN